MKILRHLLSGLALAALACSPAFAQGITATTVTVGQSAALSGPASELGIEMRQGLLAYFATVNAGGGIHGRQIELVSLDDGYEPERAAANTRELIERRNVFALIGYVGTPTSQAAVPIFTDAKVPFIGPFTGAELLREPFNRYVFNVRASYFQETERIVDHLVAAGTTRIAVFHQNDAYGRAGLAGVERAMAKRGLPIAAIATVERNSTDVAGAARALAAAKPAAVIQISAYASCAALVKAMKNDDAPVQFFNVSFVGSRPLAAALGEDGHGVMVSQVVPYPFSGVEPVVREYRSAMTAAGHEALSFTSMEGFLAAKVFVEGLRRAGPNLSRKALIDALESIRRHDFGGFVVNFTDSDHNGSDFVELTIVGRGGRFMR
ncbi:ABC transporter substrate-binding protein [Pseudothauera rhizosphaerae]|uniref:ABC transporter permease n=1 Tax=Pseudothauera rhizosphaerae TaxID=2565932 RepID=A0A4S4AJ25_9RHOO|nr:ABC transporter substrate-binding protein [Pseudothauera rhizosphaerae]THF59378.1 ABC transporter permease [Pseudothauera rhizosphaerae]